MKILLIHPPAKVTSTETNSNPFETPPLGLAYIAGVLQQNDYPVKIIDFKREESIKSVKKTIQKHRADLIGIQCSTVYRFGAIETAKIAKETNPEAKIVMGGPHATLLHEQILKNYPVDFVVRGEGEYATLELANALEKNNKLNLVKGISYKIKNKIKTTKPRKFITNLDDLPLPARELLDIKKYTFGIPKNELGKIKPTSVITTRGCPFNCLFCNSSVFWGNCWRFRSPQKVVDEIEFLRQKYKINYVSFSEDNFTANSKRTTEICQELKNRNLDIIWTCLSRADIKNKLMLKWMNKSGCAYVSMSPESGSQKILNNINKRITVKQILNAYSSCAKENIPATMELMVGNPGESQKTINETIKLIKKIKPFSVGVNIAMVLPKTRLCYLAEKSGLVRESDWLNPEFKPPFYTVESRYLACKHASTLGAMFVL